MLLVGFSYRHIRSFLRSLLLLRLLTGAMPSRRFARRAISFFVICNSFHTRWLCSSRNSFKWPRITTIDTNSWFVGTAAIVFFFSQFYSSFYSWQITVRICFLAFANCFSIHHEYKRCLGNQLLICSHPTNTKYRFESICSNITHIDIYCSILIFSNCRKRLNIFQNGKTRFNNK